MQENQKQASLLASFVEKAVGQLKLNEDRKELIKLEKAAEASNFWQDSISAQRIVKKTARLKARVDPWNEIESELKDLRELLNLNDSGLSEDLGRQLKKLENKYKKLKETLKFSGKYDDHNVILTIHSGAGGTDAQDWAQMLLRMYKRWAESHGFELKLADESAGDEAGIKSATVEITGDYVYGRLKGEHGVHRLVRLSPFNADNLRQTSFAKVEVMPKIDEPDQIELSDKELKIDVYRSSGKGGQSVNTTDSAVRVTHLPTGVVVAIQNERSQLQNKETALTILRSRLAQMSLDQHAERVSELKGSNQSAEWGNQIRSYVLHPYKQVKDLRTKHETSDPEKVLDGDIDQFIEKYLDIGTGP